MAKKSQPENIGFAPVKSSKAPEPQGGSTIGNRLAIVRALIKAGRGPKYISKHTGMDVKEIKAIREADKSIQIRKNSRQMLMDLLNETRSITSLARDTYLTNPSGYNAGAVSALNRSVLDIIGDLTKLKKPENQTLGIIQKVLQPFLRELLRDTTGELRRARQKCLATAETPEARQAIMESFELLTKSIGTITMDHYSGMIPKLAHTMECDVDDLKRLASASEDDTATKLELGEDNVVQLPKRNEG